jgi:hypothetical protein
VQIADADAAAITAGGTLALNTTGQEFIYE